MGPVRCQIKQLSGVPRNQDHDAPATGPAADEVVDSGDARALAACAYVQLRRRRDPAVQPANDHGQRQELLTGTFGLIPPAMPRSV